MSDPEGYWELHAEFCKCLAHPVRLRILDALGKGERSFGELEKITGQSKVNLSRHLTLLADRGVVRRRREGRRGHLSLANPKILRAYGLMTEAMSDSLERELAAIGERGGERG